VLLTDEVSPEHCAILVARPSSHEEANLVLAKPLAAVTVRPQLCFRGRLARRFIESSHSPHRSFAGEGRQNCLSACKSKNFLFVDHWCFPT